MHFNFRNIYIDVTYHESHNLLDFIYNGWRWGDYCFDGSVVIAKCRFNLTIYDLAK